MKKSLLGRVTVLTVLLLSALVSCSQILEGSGTTVDLNYDLDNFNGFSLRGAVDADIEQTGTEYSVTVTIDDNLADHVESQVKGGILNIGLDRMYNYQNLHFSAVIRIPADVDPVSLTVAEAAAVNMALSGSGDFILSAGDASTVNITSGWVSTGTTSFYLQGASRVIVGDGASNNGDIIVNLRDASSLDFGDGSSNGGSLDINLGEASRLNMGAYEVVNIEITAGEASSASVKSIDGIISGSLSNASSLIYRGTPASVIVSTSGASSLIDGR